MTGVPMSHKFSLGIGATVFAISEANENNLTAHRRHPPPSHWFGNALAGSEQQEPGSEMWRAYRSLLGWPSPSWRKTHLNFSPLPSTLVQLCHPHVVMLFSWWPLYNLLLKVVCIQLLRVCCVLSCCWTLLLIHAQTESSRVLVRSQICRCVSLEVSLLRPAHTMPVVCPRTSSERILGIMLLGIDSLRRREAKHNCQ